MPRITFLLAVTLVLISTGVAKAGPFRPWYPRLSGSIDRSVIPLGKTVHITYSTEGATSCQYHITQWGDILGWSDGIPIPTNHTLQITPALPGEFTVTIVAFRRPVADLNRNGKSDGRRRSTALSFPIRVVAPEGTLTPWNGRSDFEGRLWFDPPMIKAGEPTTRYWTSHGGAAYIDGQRVPDDGQDTLRPKESITSTLQVTAGRRWRWVLIYRVTVEVVP